MKALFNEMTPYKVYLTRTKDVFIPLSQLRFQFQKSACFCEYIHASASASGLETYYYGVKSNSSLNQSAVPNGNLTNSFFSKEGSLSSAITPSASRTNPYITDSKVLAALIQKHMVNVYNLKDCGTKHGNFQVIRTNNLPAVQIDLSFITKKNVAGKLDSPYWKQVATEAIYIGILDFIESKGSNVKNYRIN